MACAGREVSEHEAQFIPFSAYTRMSGVDIDGRSLRKGASSAIRKLVEELGGTIPSDFQERCGHNLARLEELRLPWPMEREHWESFT